MELRKTLAGWTLGALEDSATLVLSELVANSVRHAHVPPGREIETRFLLIPPGGRKTEGVRLEVHDASSALPRSRQITPDAACGRGLHLVEALADQWGVDARAGVGKLVWAVLRLPDTHRPAGGGAGGRAAHDLRPADHGRTRTDR
ncbi:ATP-binding protein [Streptomyces sp. NPDC096310]|uniref:ATP-binding protein n=1 Tax=Streptomyces sp. NPDC096310 TaxID=3366082 RepID=UPI003830D9BD